MTTFIKLAAERDKAKGLIEAVFSLRAGDSEDSRVFQLSSDKLREVPGTPFSYWVPDAIRKLFTEFVPFSKGDRAAVNGMTTGDDFRFVRCHWEVLSNTRCPTSAIISESSENPVVEGEWSWFTYAKGGEDSPFYGRFPMVLNWQNDGREMRAFSGTIVRSQSYYLRPGLTWPLRARRFGPQCRPQLSIFSVRGYSIIAPEQELLGLLGLCSSSIFDYLYKVSLGRHGYPEFIVGVLGKLPLPGLGGNEGRRLGELARLAWSAKRKQDTVNEISHSFILPILLRTRLGDYDPATIGAQLESIQGEIDEIAFDLYELGEKDKVEVFGHSENDVEHKEEKCGDENCELENDGISATVEIAEAGLLTWCASVAFGRFDWRLAIGEREPPPEPEPFDPLPSKSPGMLPEDAEPFHNHTGILCDDPGHPHDLVRLVESVLERVDVPVPPDIRRWLQRDFFPEHLKQYSKSRRKAPIYWPLATTSGSYTLWIYYPNLTGQTLYTAVNDFVEPKLKSVAQAAQSLRTEANRSKAEEKELEQTQDLEHELTDLRDMLLEIAKDYKPNHDDGVQITAAPLWPLFRHKPWQKVLKDTWKKLEQGDYDWAHLAMSYWPDRVREKCRTDKSLAIAHGLDELYEEPREQSKKKRGRGKAE